MPGYFAKNEQHRRLVLRALLWITLGGGLFFSVVNLLHENWLLAGLEITYAAVSLYLLSILERTRNLQLLTTIYLLPFFSIMIVALGQTHTTFAVFAWIQTIPITCYLLLGLRLGMYVSIVFVSIGLFAFSRRYSSEALLQHVEIIANIGLASLAVMIFAHIYERSRILNEQRLTEQATTDALTGLPNRLKLAEVFERERAHALRHDAPLALVFIDIDHFKQINDRFGHDVGDRALAHFATVLAQHLRSNDLFCRLGGEEFAVLLPGSTAAQAYAIANGLRERLAALPLTVEGDVLHMTLSAGVSSYGTDGQSLNELMLVADRRTYAAKRAGRNRVIARDETLQATSQA